jgi:hypothetical protein
MTQKTSEPEIFRALRGVRRLVINTCHGGFGLNDAAWHRYCDLAGWDPTDPNLHAGMIARDDVNLVAVVEELGADANGDLAQLRIVEIPWSVDWVMQEYDGKEWIAERHRTWC